MRLLCFILFFGLLFSGTSFGQSDSLTTPKKLHYDQRAISAPVHFDTKKLDNYRRDGDYDYTPKVKAENWWTLLQQWVSNQWRAFWHWLLGDYTAGSFVQTLISILPYIVTAAIIGLVIWLFIRLNPGASLISSKKKSSVFLSEEEKIMEQQDIGQLIEEAKNQKNYRLAIRYYYLLILKKLREKELIRYEFEKTNEDYLKEIPAENINLQFKTITHLYDFIWYGNFPVNQRDYQIAEEEFIKIKQQLIALSNE